MTINYNKPVVIKNKLQKAAGKRYCLVPEKSDIPEYHNYIHGFNCCLTQLFGFKEDEFFSVSELAEAVYQEICSLVSEFDGIIQQEFAKEIAKQNIKKKHSVLCLPAKTAAGYCKVYSVDFRRIVNLKQYLGINYHKEHYDDTLEIIECYFDGDNFQLEDTALFCHEKSFVAGIKKVLSKKEEASLLRLDKIIESFRKLELVAYNITNAFGSVPLTSGNILLVNGAFTDLAILKESNEKKLVKLVQIQ